MRSTLPSDVRRSTFRLAVAAVIVGLAIPLLPVFGEGGLGAFIFSQGLPVRLLILYSPRWWGSVLVAMVGIWFLKRDRPLRLLREVLPAPGEPTYPRRFDILLVWSIDRLTDRRSGP
jgi:hypothetical protein